MRIRKLHVSCLIIILVSFLVAFSETNVQGAETKVEVYTDYAVGRVWMEREPALANVPSWAKPEHRNSSSARATVPYVDNGENVTFHGMIYLLNVSPRSMLWYASCRVVFLLDGTVRSDLLPPPTYVYLEPGGRGAKFSTKGIIVTDEGKIHTFGFRVISHYLDPQPGNDENTTQFGVTGPPRARIASVGAPSLTIGKTANINVTVEWSAIFTADLRVILTDLDQVSLGANTTHEKPIAGASSSDIFTFTVAAPSKPMKWHLRAEAWTRAQGSVTWQHDSTDWSRDFSIEVLEQTGVPSPTPTFTTTPKTFQAVDNIQTYAIIGLATAVMATSVYFAMRKRRVVQPTAISQAIEIAIDVPEVGKTLMLDAEPNHTIKSIVEAVVEGLDLPKDGQYTLMLGQTKFGAEIQSITVKEAGIKHGDRLVIE